MALDEETQARYREAGPAVMLALLPELRRESARAVEAAKGFEATKTAFDDSDIELAEVANEAIASLNRKIPSDDVEARAALRALRDRFTEARAVGQASASAEAGALAHWSYVQALQERERWIMEELRALGLLPEFE